MSRGELRRLQRWFSCIVEHPSTAEAAMASRTANALVPRREVAAGRVIAVPPHGDLAVGLNVYNGGYLLRLVEVMQGDFGAVQHVVGEEAFRALVARYVAVHPSRHPNLNQLGRHFPAFLQRQRRLRHRAFLCELAALELAVCRAFDAPEFVALPTAAMAKVPSAEWARLCFTGNPSVQLLPSRHPVDAFYQAWKEGKPIAVPGASRSWLLVFRRDDRVFRQRLSRSAFAVLSALLAGKSLGRALAAAKADEPVTEWFQDFAREGLFVAVRRAAPRVSSRQRRS